MHWGDRHRAPEGPPVTISHAGCGGAVDAVLRCEHCGEVVRGRGIALAWREPLTPAAAG
jgi:hypothetical protein